jgi:2-polyprenyl-3-methyl-5-hydroxy-6-metoxy-1,4-benzoquinol methylase
MIASMVCRAAAFEEPWFGEWARRLRIDDPSQPLEQRNVHRKVWEWVCIAQTLYERNMLSPGRTGLGFAVGSEKLPSLFASLGARIVATDIGDAAIASLWAKTDEYTGALDGLYVADLIDRSDFERRVTYRHVDMRDLSQLEPEHYDFVWSSCALEHLGTLDAGLNFIVESTRLLRPGGVAVHTTEFNLSSMDATVSEGETVLYRRADLERLDCMLRDRESGLVRLDLDPGTHEYDLKYDVEPFHHGQRRHLKLRLCGYVSTSVLAHRPKVTFHLRAQRRKPAAAASLWNILTVSSE